MIMSPWDAQMVVGVYCVCVCGGAFRCAERRPRRSTCDLQKTPPNSPEHLNHVLRSHQVGVADHEQRRRGKAPELVGLPSGGGAIQLDRLGDKRRPAVGVIRCCDIGAVPDGAHHVVTAHLIYGRERLRV
jgi:hypothetical protein